MSAPSTNFSSFVRQRAEDAQTTVSRLEAEYRKTVKNIFDRSRNASDDRRKQVDDFFKTLRNQDVLQRLRSKDVKRQLEEFRGEILDIFGLATREQIATLTARIELLEHRLTTASAKKTTKAKKTTAKKTVTKKATAKTAATKKAATRKAPTKKAATKKTAAKK